MSIYASDMPNEMEKIARTLQSGDLTDSLGAVGIVLQEGLAKNFASQMHADGGIWPDRVKEGDVDHPMLIETGALQAAASGTGSGSIRRIVDGRTVEVGVDKSIDRGGIPGAAVHNYGHDFGKFKVPKREWLYASGATLDKASEVLADQLMSEVF